MSFSTFAANTMLDYSFRNVSFTRPTQWYVQLHTGDPGLGGTSNLLASTARIACTSWREGSGQANSRWGWIRNSVAIRWTSVGATSSVPYCTVWDAVSGGNCLFIASLEKQETGAPSAVVGDKFLIPPYYLTLQWVGT